MVVPCTGRAWRESHRPLRHLPNPGPGVFATGAAVTQVDTGQSLDLAVIDARLAHRLVRFLNHLPEAVLVLRDHDQAGHDYLVTGQGALTPSTQTWFELTGATAHFQKHVTPDDMHNTLRVGVVTASDRVGPIRDRVEQTFTGRVQVQSFQALETHGDHGPVHVLEIFAAGVDKTRGLSWIADRHGIAPHEIAAIGDQVNDTAMIRAAACGIAMANAAEPVKAVADQHTLDCESDGVAHAIDRLLAGDW
jgi:hydroxymethylpyrimidine pyrophosphatase-like HAD family hydrolase